MWLFIEGVVLLKHPWTHDKTEFFIEKGALSEKEAYIMRSRVRGATVTEQALYLHVSEASVHRIIRNLKDKYDRVQIEYPDVLPVRRKSKAEDYMDTH